MEEQQRRKQKELDSILDAALDALDDDDDDDESDCITSHHETGDKYKFDEVVGRNQHTGDGINNTKVARQGCDNNNNNNCNSGTAPIIGVPYSLEYIANNEQRVVAETNISSSSSSKQKHNGSNNSRRPQFGPEPPPSSSSPSNDCFPSDPQLSPYDIGSMMGGASGNEAELAASLESMMKQFTQELGGMGMGGVGDGGADMQAMDEMFKQMMANMPTDDVMSSKKPSQNNSSQTNPSSSPTKSKTTPREVNGSNNNNTKEHQDSEPNVDESINRLLDGINQAATSSMNNNNNNTNPPLTNMMPDNIDPTQFEQFSEEMMSSIMHEFEKMNNKSDSNDIVDDVMKQLLSKDLMYEPMKEVCTRFPKFLAENKEGMSNEEYEKYGKQYQYFQRIVRVYEVEPNNYDRLMELMQEIQEYGQPPVEIIKDLAPELEFDEEGMPIMNPLAGGGGMPSPMGMMMGGGGNEQCCIS